MEGGVDVTMTWKVTIKELFVLTVPMLTPLFGFASGMVLPFTAKLFSIKVVPSGMRSEIYIRSVRIAAILN